MRFIVIIIASLLTASCGIQSIPESVNDVEAKWAEVSNQYKRRSDLIPNLVITVKGYAAHEKETLESVISARAKATQVTLQASELTQEKLQQFQAAQGQLSQALGKLMVVSERYPDLKASKNFSALQSQLEGTENRITIARQRYIKSVQKFNNLVSVFPTNLTNNWFFGYEKKPQFTISPEESYNPKIEF